LFEVYALAERLRQSADWVLDNFSASQLMEWRQYFELKKERANAG